MPENIPPTKTSDFFCEICKKTFTLKRNLTRHMKLHSSDGLRFKCPWPNCGKMFARQTDREIHTKGHTGERNYPCTHMTVDSEGRAVRCTKRFLRLSDLNVHIRRHQTKKGFSCPNCIKQFIRKCDLVGHSKRCKAVKAESVNSESRRRTSSGKANRKTEPFAHKAVLVKDEESKYNHNIQMHPHPPPFRLMNQMYGGGNDADSGFPSLDLESFLNHQNNRSNSISGRRHTEHIDLAFDSLPDIKPSHTLSTLPFPTGNANVMDKCNSCPMSSLLGMGSNTHDILPCQHEKIQEALGCDNNDIDLPNLSEFQQKLFQDLEDIAATQFSTSMLSGNSGCNNFSCNGYSNGYSSTLGAGDHNPERKLDDSLNPYCNKEALKCNEKGFSYKPHTHVNWGSPKFEQYDHLALLQ